MSTETIDERMSRLMSNLPGKTAQLIISMTEPNLPVDKKKRLIVPEEDATDSQATQPMEAQETELQPEDIQEGLTQTEQKQLKAIIKQAQKEAKTTEKTQNRPDKQQGGAQLGTRAFPPHKTTTYTL